MNDIIQKIVSYLTYLNTECNLSVSVHFGSDIFNALPSHITESILPFNRHTNAYCVKVKSKDYNKCLDNQKTIRKKCRKDESFCHVCHAEVAEYIHPVCRGDEVVGFVAASGYKSKTHLEENILGKELWDCALKNEKIPHELCDTVIAPLCIMLEQMLLKYLKESSNEYSLILQFLSEYHTNITLSDLAKHFGRSNSHISHLFKKESGMTIRAWCNNLKLEDAKKLLVTTNLPITDVAYDVGFGDTSYFVKLFKEKEGITPLQFKYKNR